LFVAQDARVSTFYLSPHSIASLFILLARTALQSLCDVSQRFVAALCTDLARFASLCTDLARFVGALQLFPNA
jgi:hypothetical protein